MINIFHGRKLCLVFLKAPFWGRYFSICLYVNFSCLQILYAEEKIPYSASSKFNLAIEKLEQSSIQNSSYMDIRERRTISEEMSKRVDKIHEGPLWIVSLKKLYHFKEVLKRDRLKQHRETGHSCTYTFCYGFT